jgi:hypothetical protein
MNIADREATFRYVTRFHKKLLITVKVLRIQGLNTYLYGLNISNWECNPTERLLASHPNPTQAIQEHFSRFNALEETLLV